MLTWSGRYRSGNAVDTWYDAFLVHPLFLATAMSVYGHSVHVPHVVKFTGMCFIDDCVDDAYQHAY